MTNPTGADGAFGSAKRATTKERVAMATRWEIADAIPDALYFRAGKWISDYWEKHVLTPNRFEVLEWFARDLGTLAEASAFPVEVARGVVHAFVGELVSRGCKLPDDALTVADGWFESGRGLDARPVVYEWESAAFGDPKHKPSFRPAPVAAPAR